MTEIIRSAVGSAHAAGQPLSRRELLLLLSKAAARGISVRPAVRRADVVFTGEPGSTRVSIQLVLGAGEDPRRVLDEAHEEIVPGLEAILGEPFAEVCVHWMPEAVASSGGLSASSGFEHGLLAA
ncbi:hypothetical protein [Rothia kristinae]|uniref:Cation efflux protein cytoplasmic domain-containing protein n=1 Tax=Rothia kristinae TaxID=37923 RepID=A0A1S2N1W9_9MICC|nr:hypothetical protein [Rothia kristinae]MBE8527883.1 hypothetical protein [Amycolatopsis sp. H6(2020)]OIJ36378.1 hypothetical protein BK826_02810 [Rothia kristinae]